MILRRLFGLSSLLLITSMGCCHSRCVCSDPCDPCGGGGGGTPSCGRYVSGWMNNKVDSWRMRNQGRNCGCNDMACGCDTCGMGFEGEMMGSSCASGNCGSPMMSGSPMMGGSPSGCACGQNHGAVQSEYAPSVPGASSIPAGSPTVAPTPVPAQQQPTGNEPAPAPASSDLNTTSLNRSMASQPQQVSVEEFHRLPGVVVAGPTTQTSLPSMAGAAQPVMAAPQLSAVPASPRAQQVNWTPTKP